MLIMVPSNTPIKVVVIIAAITRARAGPAVLRRRVDWKRASSFVLLEECMDDKTIKMAFTVRKAHYFHFIVASNALS